MIRVTYRQRAPVLMYSLIASESVLVMLMGTSQVESQVQDK
jgi:hypothetical protein